MRPKAINVIAKEDYTLLVEFDNGEIKVFDVKPYLSYKAFEELKDIKKFNSVKITGLSVGWNNGADICPDELYNNSVVKN
ncbi:MAG: DUF2442 domain-containing protein [Clostridia bacterium]|nr:DUF2442 domain-containing protein [Clostridia bacterium]